MLWYVDLDPVVRPEDVPQVVNRVENMNANATIKACRFEKPQILALVLRWSNSQRRADHFVESALRELHLCIQFRNRQVDVLFEERDDLKNLFKLYAVVVILKVHRESQRDHIVHI